MPYELVVMALEPDLTKDQSASPDCPLKEQRVILITDIWFVTQQIKISGGTEGSHYHPQIHGIDPSQNLDSSTA